MNLTIAIIHEFITSLEKIQIFNTNSLDALGNYQTACRLCSVLQTRYTFYEYNSILKVSSFHTFTIYFVFKDILNQISWLGLGKAYTMVCFDSSSSNDAVIATM